MQYNLEAWRREAMMKGQQGDAARLEAMLQTFPSSFALESEDKWDGLFNSGGEVEYDEHNDGINELSQSGTGAGEDRFPPLAPPPPVSPPLSPKSERLVKSLRARASVHFQSSRREGGSVDEGIIDAPDAIHAAEVLRSSAIGHLPEPPSPDRRRRNSFRELFNAEAPKLKESKAIAKAKPIPAPVQDIRIDWSNLPPPL